jgi:hypothetical protein
MALTQGPLLSLSASGKFAGALVYSTWKGRPVVRQLVTPSNPKSVSQVATRAMFAFLAQNWAALSGASQATWEALAAQTNIAPFNAYLAYNMDRWTQYTFPKDEPSIAAGTVPVMGAGTLTGGVRQYTLSQVITTANQISGIVVIEDAAAIVTPVKTMTVKLFDYLAASPIVGIMTPRAPGTYHVRVAGFTTGGALSAYIADQTVVVT